LCSSSRHHHSGWIDDLQGAWTSLFMARFSSDVSDLHLDAQAAEQPAGRRFISLSN
jgi:hypothetical protein